MNKAFSSYKTWVLWKASLQREGKSGAQEDRGSELIPSFSLPLVSNACHVGYKTFLRYARPRKQKEMRSRFGRTNHCVVSPSLELVICLSKWGKGLLTLACMCSKRERDFRFWPREKWNESPSPLFNSLHFSRSLWLSFLVRCSENAETLDTQPILTLVKVVLGDSSSATRF